MKKYDAWQQLYECSYALQFKILGQKCDFIQQLVCKTEVNIVPVAQW